MAIINPWIFYLIDVLSSLKGITLTAIVITLFGSIGLGTYIVVHQSCYCYGEEDRHLITKLTKILKKGINCFMHYHRCVHSHSFRRNHVQNVGCSKCNL